jgi:heterodisulfide reductase subunit A-like polyferredoxin
MIFTSTLWIFTSLVLCLEASSIIEQSSNNTRSQPTAGNTRDSFLRQILHNSSAYGNFSLWPSKIPLKVGIIGAGVAGLYSALLLESLGIDYEILEANSRIGGRIYTHRFDEATWLKSKPGDPAYYNYYVCSSRVLSDEMLTLLSRMSGPCVFQEWHGWKE